LTLEPSGISASDFDAGEGSEVRETALPLPVRPGFEEPSALFRTTLDLPVELRALRGHVDPVFLRWTAARAETLGIGAGAIVARSGVISPDAMLEAYAADLGVEIDPLENIEARALDVAKTFTTGVLPAATDHGRNEATIALTGENTRAIYAFGQGNAELSQLIKITSIERLRAFLLRSKEKALAEDAAFGLLKRNPSFSAGKQYFRNPAASAAVLAAVAALSFYFATTATLLAIELLLAATFISWSALRISACFAERPEYQSIYIDDRDLPTYTILVPLYREANVVFDLVEAISALNYPREKLDVKIILEKDDQETIEAISAITIDPCFEIIFAPREGPRTKPKALRTALPFVRGKYVVVYDAEDRPHPNQLRDAYARFLSGGERLACVQAKLAIDNAYSSLLTAHFRAEYCGLFDVLLPALVRFQLPIPLGGTSNHFDVKALRAVEAWDPHNVTEDADLGIRLARFGYKTDCVNSTTWEEAPASAAAWIPQRTRWMKGWLQTFLVHMRHPRELWADLGPRGFLAFQLLIGGSVLSALVHPIFLVWLLVDAAFGSLLMPPQTFVAWADRVLICTTLVSGYAASALLAWIGMRKRGLRLPLWVLATIPVYWIFLSMAAWRAVWKLLADPYQWEKTMHGVAQRARSNN
jgi:cellulose synthase/poly-beta-1,6-N-acetylglucosamine synthase-like glycosyltransferase